MDTYLPFSDYLLTHTELDELAMQQLIRNCPELQIKKGGFLQPRYGQNQSFYVQKGLLRLYAIDDKGKEHIIQFAPEGWFISDRLSECHIKQSDFFIEALEDTEALVLEMTFIDTLAKSDESFLAFNNKLLHNHIRQLQGRINQLLSFTAEERYIDFIHTYPNIMLRVPQSMVASYLGITPESLSRVRKDMAERNKK